jgi:hypothetical protein
MGVVGRLDQYASMLATEFDDYSMSENLLKYSNDFSQGVWVGYCGGKSNITYNTTDVVSPDGRNDATKVARSSNGCDGSLSWGFHWNSSTGGIIIDTTNTFTASIYARGAVGGEVINIGFNDSQITNHTLTTSWQRISRTGIANTTDRGFQVKSDTINQTFYIWKGQLEKGSVATDYTPTTTTAISRVLPATTNTNITGLGTYYSSGFDENVGFTTFLSANISPPYDLVYDEFSGTLFGAGQGRYMRQNTDKSVIVYNEIDEITDFRDIVRTGMVLDLDAGMNSSYSGSGEIWTDLSGIGNNGTLTNGPTYSSSNGGSLVFDGVDDNVTSSLSSSLGTQFSISVWFKKNNNNVGNLVNFQGSPTLELLVDQTNQLNIWDGANHLYSFTTTIGTWYNMTVVKNSTNFLLYVNNNSSPVLNFVSSYNNTNTNFIIGKHPTASNYINGNIAQVSIYNRALTAAEISQNYNALRNRFGL